MDAWLHYQVRHMDGQATHMGTQHSLFPMQVGQWPAAWLRKL